jgi:hypothetical protein
VPPLLSGRCSFRDVRYNEAVTATTQGIRGAGAAPFRGLLLICVCVIGCGRSGLDVGPAEIPSGADDAGTAAAFDHIALADAATPSDADRSSAFDGAADSIGAVDSTPASPAMRFCFELVDDRCAHAFECTPPGSRDVGFESTFGFSEDDCRAKLSGERCVFFDESCPTFSASSAQGCLKNLATETCAEYNALFSPSPIDCDSVCPVADGPRG